MLTLLETGLLITVVASGALTVGYCASHFRKLPRRVAKTTLVSR